MKRLTIDKWFQLLLVLLMVIVTVCLLQLRGEIRKVAQDLESFKVETYDRERSLISAKVAREVEVQTGEIEVSADVQDVTVSPNVIYDIADENDYVVTDNDGVGNLDYILRVLTAEAGSDEVLCGCVAQALYNACEKEGWQYSVEQMLYKYGYTGPSSWISDAAVKAWDDVFCSGYRYTDIGNAIYFYAPRYCDSSWHESQKYVCTVSEVRFFEEWD